MERDDTSPMSDEEQLGVVCEESPFSMTRWKAGVAPPPFISTNPTAMALLEGLADGEIDQVPSIHVSHAVAPPSDRTGSSSARSRLRRLLSHASVVQVFSSF